MRNQNKQSRSYMTKSQKQTKENRKYVKSLIQLGQKEKRFGRVIFGSKLTQNHPSEKKEEEKGDGQGLRKKEGREEERGVYSQQLY